MRVCKCTRARVWEKKRERKKAHISVLDTRCKQRILIPHSFNFSSLQIFHTIKWNFWIPARIIWYDRRVLGNSPLSILFCYFLPYRARCRKGLCNIRVRRLTRTFSFTLSSSLCRAVGNFDACGHFAQNVSPNAPRDIRRQKRGTSPNSIIMCVTCEGEETSFCVQSLSGVSCSTKLTCLLAE